TFADINTNYKNPDYIKDRAILTTRNIDVEDINQLILQKIPDTEKFEYLSADSVKDKDQGDQSLYPVEFLNTLTPSGMPPYHLVLKKDVLVILLRNLDPTEGLCNSTRLIIKNCYKFILDAEILTGVNKGK
ncbi:42811_t:CDS:1, partial [Gigaspora margarita]